MSEFSYTYSLADDFGGNVDTSQFHQEVENDGSISPTILRVDAAGDNISVVFDAELDAGEETELDNLVAAHVPVTILSYNKSVNCNFPNNNVTNDVYNRIGTYTFPGSQSIGTIQKITAIGRMDVGVTNFTIQVFDSTNENVIASATFTNTSDAIVDLGSISNVPNSQSIIEFMVKKTGGSGNQGAHIDSVTLFI